jgi:hypothetical protein
VPIDSQISVSFNGDIEEGSSFGSICIKDAAGVKIPAAASVSADTLVLTPISPLGYEKVYRVVIPAGAVRLKGTSVKNSSEYISFITESINLPLAIMSTSPKFGDTDVLADKSIFISFNECITKGTGFDNIKMTDASGKTVETELTVKDNNIIINPKYKLEENTKYTVEIPAGAAVSSVDSDSSKQYSFSFTTKLITIKPEVISCNILNESMNTVSLQDFRIKPKDAVAKSIPDLKLILNIVLVTVALLLIIVLVIKLNSQKSMN